MSYSRTTPPSPNDASFGEYLLDQLELIERAFLAPQDVALLRERHSEPVKPRTGMVVLADGTDWNPGSGAGFYGYYDGVWNKLG